MGLCGSSPDSLPVHLPVPSHESDLPEFGLENLRKALRVLELEMGKRDAGGKGEGPRLHSTVERLDSMTLHRAPGTPSVVKEARHEVAGGVRRAGGKRVVTSEVMHAAISAVDSARKAGWNVEVAVEAKDEIRLGCEMVLANQRFLRHTNLRFEGHVVLSSICTCAPPLPAGRVHDLVRLFRRVNRSGSGEVSTLELDQWLTSEIENLTYSVFLPMLMQVVPHRRAGFFTLREFVAWVELVCVSDEDEILRAMFFEMAQFGKRTHPVLATTPEEALEAPALAVEGGQLPGVGDGLSGPAAAPLLWFSPIVGVAPEDWKHLRRAEPYLLPTRLPAAYPELERAERHPIGDVNATMLEGLFRLQKDAANGIESKARKRAMQSHMAKAIDLLTAARAWRPAPGEALLSYQEFAAMLNSSPTARFPLEYLVERIRKQTLGEGFSKRRRHAIDSIRASVQTLGPSHLDPETPALAKESGAGVGGSGGGGRGGGGGVGGGGGEGEELEGDAPSLETTKGHAVAPARRFLLPYEFLHTMSRVAFALAETKRLRDRRARKAKDDSIGSFTSSGLTKPLNLNPHDLPVLGDEAHDLTKPTPSSLASTHSGIFPKPKAKTAKVASSEEEEERVEDGGEVREEPIEEPTEGDAGKTGEGAGTTRRKRGSKALKPTMSRGEMRRKLRSGEEDRGAGAITIH